MGQNSKIQWCDHTFNPWIGCTKVSPGCAHCYAEANRAAKSFGVQWGKDKLRYRTSAANWEKPLQWNRQGQGRVFCASLADVFDEEVPDDWRHELFDLIYECKNLTWLILTKRPAKALNFILGTSGAGAWFSELFPHVWMGVSVEDQKRADERIPLLTQIPAAIRFLCVEPMLGPIYFHDAFYAPDHFDQPLWPQYPKVHWTIFGGESGPGARDCDVDWIRCGLLQCRIAGVAPFVKQVGQRAFIGSGPARVALDTQDPKGGDPAEWPEELRVRKFPNADRTLQSAE